MTPIAGQRLLGADWKRAEDYAALRQQRPQAFAWEWLRRTGSYQKAWAHHRSTVSPHAVDAMQFGLVSLVDPALPADAARPLWHADVDASVIVAEVLDADAPPQEGLDLLAVASLVTLQIGRNEDEHLLLSDGSASVRLDVVRGTVVGGPALLGYRLWGAARLKIPLVALRRLIALIVTGGFPRHLYPEERKADRWIMELRVADAIRAGASHREIAGGLFPSMVKADDWRSDGETARSRVQRLVRAARLRSAEGQHLKFLKLPG